MLKNSTDVVLYRIDPSQNMQRFYTVSVSSNLFGGGSLIKSWGRIGTRGQSKVEFFDDECLAHSDLYDLLFPSSSVVMFMANKQGYRRKRFIE